MYGSSKKRSIEDSLQFIGVRLDEFNKKLDRVERFYSKYIELLETMVKDKGIWTKEEVEEILGLASS